jgi:hypothetical protein
VSERQYTNQESDTEHNMCRQTSVKKFVRWKECYLHILKDNIELKSMDNICECVHDILTKLQRKPLCFVSNKKNLNVPVFCHTIQNTEYDVKSTLLKSIVLQVLHVSM